MARYKPKHNTTSSTKSHQTKPARTDNCICSHQQNESQRSADNLRMLARSPLSHLRISLCLVQGDNLPAKCSRSSYSSFACSWSTYQTPGSRGRSRDASSSGGLLLRWSCCCCCCQAFPVLLKSWWDCAVACWNMIVLQLWTHYH